MLTHLKIKYLDNYLRNLSNTREKTAGHIGRSWTTHSAKQGLNLSSAQSCTVSDKFYLPAALRLYKTKGASHAKLGP